jgi:hypothetical protein
VKHIILGFLVLFVVPLVSSAWMQSYGRGFAVVLLFVAVGQVFIGVTKLGGEGHNISDAASAAVLIAAAICALLGTVFILRKSRRT